MHLGTGGTVKIAAPSKRRSILKPFLILLILALLAGGGVGAYLWWRPHWFGAPDDLFFLPDGCQVAASINVPACLVSKSHQRLKAQGAGIEGSEEAAFHRFTGVALSDVTSLTIGGRFDDDPDWVMIVHSTRIVTPSDLQPEGSGDHKASRVGKYTLYDRSQDAFCLPDRRMVVLGKSETLRRVLLRNRTPELAAGLVALRDGDGGRALTIVVDAKAIPRRLNRLDDINLSALTAAAQHAETIRLESTPEEPLDLHITLGCADAAAALDTQKQLARALETVGRTPRLPPEVARLLKALQFSAEESRLIAHVQVPLELLSVPLLALKQERPEFWLAALRDKDAQRRTEARRRLLARPAEALPQLSAALRDRDPQMRLAVIGLLGEMGDEAADAAPALAERTADADSAVRRAAIEALAKIGPKAKNTAFTFLLQALGDADADVRQAAQSALDRVGLPTSKDRDVLVTALRKTRLGVKPRVYALNALAGMQLETKELVAILTEALQDPEAEVRRRAALHLGKYGSKARETALPALVSALKDHEADVRAAAVAGLDALGGFRRADVPLLIDAYKEVNTPADSRAALVRWLGEMGPDAKDATFPILLDARNRPDALVRKAAAAALERMGTAAAVDVSHLLAALRKSSTREESRLEAVRMLAEAGPRAGEARSLLLDLLNDQSPELRGAALAALRRIGPPGKADGGAILHALQDSSSSSEARCYAAGVLPELRGEMPQANRLLLKALRDKDVSVRRTAARSLVRLKPKTTESIEAYAAALEDGDREVRLQVVTALSELPAERCPTTSLLKAFADEDDEVARKAVEGLARKGRPVKEDVPLLAAALGDKKARVRICAANALIELGPEAASAVAPLTRAVKDSDSSVRLLAMTALRGIGSEAEEAAPVLAEVLKDDNAALRLEAAVTLVRLHREAKNAVPIVFAAALDKASAEQSLAVEALGWVGPWAQEAMPFLLAALQKEEMRAGAVPLLVKIGKASVAELRELLNSKDDRVRLAVVEVLGQIGPEARSALLGVNTLALKDPNAEVRAAAKKASQQIQRRE
jgi:HEAT repeat protein